MAQTVEVAAFILTESPITEQEKSRNPKNSTMANGSSFKVGITFSTSIYSVECKLLTFLSFNTCDVLAPLDIKTPL